MTETATVTDDLAAWQKYRAAYREWEQDYARFVDSGLEDDYPGPEHPEVPPRWWVHHCLPPVRAARRPPPTYPRDCYDGDWWPMPGFEDPVPFSG